jgi:hypothetical protein
MRVRLTTNEAVVAALPPHRAERLGLSEPDILWFRLERLRLDTPSWRRSLSDSKQVQQSRN